VVFLTVFKLPIQSDHPRINRIFFSLHPNQMQNVFKQCSLLDLPHAFPRETPNLSDFFKGPWVLDQKLATSVTPQRVIRLSTAPPQAHCRVQQMRRTGKL
jgi:hypothetical protein